MGITELTIEERNWEMTLGGEQMLACTMHIPHVDGTGRAAKRIARHYKRLETLWTNYVRRELYLYACLEFAQRQEQSRPFRAWQGRLDCKLSWQRGGIAGLRVSWWERRGFRAPEERVWGDTWYLDSGEVCTLGAFAPHKRLGAIWISGRPGVKELGRCREFYPAADGLHLIGRGGQEGTVQMA